MPRSSGKFSKPNLPSTKLSPRVQVRGQKSQKIAQASPKASCATPPPTPDSPPKSSSLLRFCCCLKWSLKALGWFRVSSLWFYYGFRVLLHGDASSLRPQVSMICLPQTRPASSPTQTSSPQLLVRSTLRGLIVPCLVPVTRVPAESLGQMSAIDACNLWPVVEGLATLKPEPSSGLFPVDSGPLLGPKTVCTAVQSSRG